MIDATHERLCPTLWTAIREGRNLITNSKAFAGEYHRLLLSLLQQSKTSMQQLVRIRRRKNLPFREDGSEERLIEMTELRAAQRAIVLLLDIVGQSRVLAVHMDLLECCGVLREPIEGTHCYNQRG